MSGQNVKSLSHFFLVPNKRYADLGGCAVNGIGLRPSLLRVAGSNPTGGMDVCCERCVLPGRSLCYGLIILPE